MMDRKTIWIIVGCLVALVAWQKAVDYLYPPTPKKPKPAAATVTNVPAATVATTNISETFPPTPTAPEPAPELEPEQPLPPEQIVALRNAYVRIEFTTHGGGIRAVELLRYRANGTGNVVLNALTTEPALVLHGFAGADAAAAFELVYSTADTVLMRKRTTTGYDVTKTFVLGSDYSLTGTIDVVRSAETVSATQAIDLVIGTISPAHPREQHTSLGLDLMVHGKFQTRNIWDNSGFLIFRQPKMERKQLQETVPAQWVAVKDQFFTMILTPATNTLALSCERGPLPKPTTWTGKDPPQGLTAAVTLAASSSTGDGAAHYDFSFYAGPKEYDRLVALGKGQEEVMQFGFWSPISVVLLKSMNYCYKLIPNYGIAIILITIVIKLLFWPIQAKSIRSMKEMQKFQPLMAKLREKYKDDAQRLNAEMMKLYKEHKVNPFAGCLPMVVQIPVFFGLFTMLRSAIELRGARFLWIKDLSQPDTIFSIAGLPINPLPLVMVGSMIWQQKITPTTADPQQARMMMLMPLMMLLFFYNASSGLALYWTVQQLLSIAQQWWSLRQSGPPAAPSPQPAGKSI